MILLYLSTLLSLKNHLYFIVAHFAYLPFYSPPKLFFFLILKQKCLMFMEATCLSWIKLGKSSLFYSLRLRLESTSQSNMGFHDQVSRRNGGGELWKVLHQQFNNLAWKWPTSFMLPGLVVHPYNWEPGNLVAHVPKWKR